MELTGKLGDVALNNEGLSSLRVHVDGELFILNGPRAKIMELAAGLDDKKPVTLTVVQGPDAV